MPPPLPARRHPVEDQGDCVGGTVDLVLLDESCGGDDRRFVVDDSGHGHSFGSEQGRLSPKFKFGQKLIYISLLVKKVNTLCKYGIL